MNAMSLDGDKDIYIEGGVIARAEGSDAILQTIKTRLMTVRQEYFLDLDAGLPWYTELMGKNVDLEKIRAHVAIAIVNTTGVSSLNRLALEIDKSSRALNIEFSYSDIYGKNITGGL